MSTKPPAASPACAAWERVADERIRSYRYDGAPLRERAGGCGRRNVYVDMGANWCNTLRLYRHVPGTPKEDAARPWQVFAFEVAPLIMPYVERCCVALSRGEPLPSAPVPPSGSSGHLLSYGKALGCHHGMRGHQFDCIERAINKSLHALRPDRALYANRSLIDERLRAARWRGCAGRGGSGEGGGEGGLASSSSVASPPQQHHHFSLIPAGVGARDSSLELGASARGLMQLLRGGQWTGTRRDEDGDKGRGVEVAVTDVVRWLQRSFSVEDHVVLKMDVEGAEEDVVLALLASNTTRLVDALLWECHGKNRCLCAAWDRALLANGVGKIYHDPYPFARANEYPPFSAAAMLAPP